MICTCLSPLTFLIPGNEIVRSVTIISVTPFTRSYLYSAHTYSRTLCKDVVETFLALSGQTPCLQYSYLVEIHYLAMLLDAAV